MTPNCPHCGQPPLFVFGEGTQAWCGNTDCDVLAWNPTQTTEELEAHRKEIDLENRH